jgi:hypothetical protein
VAAATRAGSCDFSSDEGEGVAQGDTGGKELLMETPMRGKELLM